MPEPQRQEKPKVKLSLVRFNSEEKQEATWLYTLPLGCLNIVKEKGSSLKVFSKFQYGMMRKFRRWIVIMATEKCECTQCHQKVNFLLLNTAWYYYLVITQPLRALTIRIWQPRVWDLIPTVIPLAPGAHHWASVSLSIP